MSDQHTAENDAAYQPCNAECNGCPACDPGCVIPPEVSAS